MTHQEYKDKLAQVASLAVSYVKTDQGYYQMRDASMNCARSQAQTRASTMKRPSADAICSSRVSASRPSLHSQKKPTTGWKNS